MSLYTVSSETLTIVHRSFIFTNKNLHWCICKVYWLNNHSINRSIHCTYIYMKWYISMHYIIVCPVLRKQHNVAVNFFFFQPERIIKKSTSSTSFIAEPARYKKNLHMICFLIRPRLDFQWCVRELEFLKVAFVRLKIYGILKNKRNYIIIFLLCYSGKTRMYYCDRTLMNKET